CAAKRTTVLEVSRSGRSGEIVFQDGEIVAIRVGRFLDHEAFDLLLMWADATCKLRPHAGSIDPPMATEELIDAGLGFVAQLDSVAEVIGGPRSTIGVDQDKLDSPTLRLPPSVRAFISSINVGMRLPDLVSQSAFALNDGLKIVHRLCQLGVFVVRDAAAAGPSMAAQMAVVDWLVAAAPAPSQPAHELSVIVAPLAPAPVVPAPMPPPFPAATAVRSDGVPENTGGRQKFARGDLSFDEQDRAFFAREVLLEGPESTDRFEDLEDTNTRRKIDADKHKL
ncbi:MAG: DUF4388 domain-containing protein, partial [Polyangia bacterium]